MERRRIQRGHEGFYKIMEITVHAYKKSRQRFRWKSKTLDRMAIKAFEEGIHHKDTKAYLNKYISRKWKLYPHVNNVRIYGENIFFFTGDVLITLYRLPQELIKYVKI